MRLSFARLKNGLFAALAAVAVTLALLRPACELSVEHAGVGVVHVHAGTLTAGMSLERGSSAESCCDMVSDPGSAASLLVAPAGAPFTPEFVPALFIAVLMGSALLARQRQWLRAPPQAPKSFYLRSTRILR